MTSPIILRQRSGPIITIVVCAFFAVLLVDAVIRGAWESVVRFLPPLALIAWVVYSLLWRPAVLVGRDSVTVRDIFSTTVMPYAQVSEVRLTSVVAITAYGPDGFETTYHPWNAPGMPRRKVDPGLRGSRAPESLENHPSIALLHAWQHFRAEAQTGTTAEAQTDASAEETVTTWNITVIGVGLILVLLVAVPLL